VPGGRHHLPAARLLGAHRSGRALGSTAGGSGTQRLYGFRDILVLKVVKRLLDTGVSLQQIRIAISVLRERGVDDLARSP
jgi:DNA-binding transcriptional MerR regulator